MIKFYIVLCLLWSGMVISSDLGPARQIIVQQQQIAKDGSGFVVDLAAALKIGTDKVEYLYQDVVIGRLISDGSFYIFAGEAEYDFRFINMPDLDSLKIISGGSLLFDSLVQAKNHLIIYTPKTVVFRQGFKLSDGRAFAHIGAERLELFGASQAKSLLLEAVKDLAIKKDASLELSLLASSKALNLANYGTLRVTNNKNISLSTLINNGIADFTNGSLSIESFDNRGVFKAAVAQVSKKWLNSAKGEVAISLSLRTEGELFDDKGRTVVGGLASISAIRGSISNSLRARKAVIAFENETALPKGARIDVQEHLTFHSGDSLNIYGDIVFQNITEFPSPAFTGDARMRYGRLKPGVVISAKQNLRKEGRVEARGNITYSAGKAFISKSGTNKTGVFNNSLTVLAESVSIHDSIKSSSDALLFASNTMDLDGEHFIENALVLESKLLHQQSGNKIMARSILSNSERAMLEGSLNAAKITVRAKGELETSASFKSDAKLTMLDAELAYLGGKIKSESLQGKANIITEYKSLSLDVTNSTLNADVIKHESGSLHNVSERNVELARSHIEVEKDAQVNAQDNILKAKDYIWNAGGISSRRSYLGDTRWHNNLFGAKITAPNIRIYADYASENNGEISGDETKINSVVNFNNGIIRGRRSLHINALLANIDAGMTISANRNVASPINISPYSLNLTDFSLDTQMANLLSPANLMRGGIKAAAYAGMLPAVAALQGAQAAYGAYNFANELYQFATDISNSNEDFWRLSRVAENASRCVSLAKQGYGVCQSFENHSNDKDKKKDEKSSATNAWQEMADLGRDFVGGNSNVTSMFHWDQGAHITGHVSRHTIFDYDDSLLTACFSKDIKTYTGYDHSNSYGYNSNTYSMSDYHVGGGNRQLLGKYSVVSDGQLLVGGGGNTKASEVFLSGQKSHVEAGQNFDVDKFTQLGKDGALFDGNLSAQAASGSVRVQSENGLGSIGDNAQITLKGSSSGQGAPALIVSGNISRISGAISSAIPGLTIAAIGTAEAVQGSGSNINLPDGHLHLEAKHVDVENGSSTIAASRHIQSETFKLSGFSSLSGTDRPLTVVGNGEVMPEAHIVAPNSSPKENNPEGKDATPPKESAVFQGNVLLAGIWELASDILLLKPITKKDENGDTPKDTPSDPSQRITLASGLKLTSKGKLIAINEGMVIKEEGAQIQAEDIILHGDAGGELAGAFTAVGVAMFTHNTGELKILASTKGKAEQFILGSFPEEDKKEQQEQIGNPPEDAPLPPSKNGKSTKNKDGKAKSNKPLTQEEKNLRRKPARNKVNKPAVEPADAKTLDEESPPEMNKPPEDVPLPPIKGSLTIEEGASFDGKVMKLRGNGIGNLNDLFTQTGYYKNFNISDHLFVHTDKSVEFNKDAKSAPRSFELHTSEIKVTNKAQLDTDEILILHSIDHDLWLGNGVKIAAGVYLEVMSDHDIVGDFKKKIITHRDGRQTVKYKGVILEGGSGIEYEYTDPDTGEISKRRIGLNVDAKGQINATGLKISTPLGVDARVRGKKEINNKAASQIYIKEIKKKSNWWRHRTKTHYDTEFLQPSAVIGGKLILESEEGGLFWQAGEFLTGEGADLILNGDVNLLPVKGKMGKVTERETLIPVLDSEDYSVHGLKPSVIFISQSDAPVRIWTTKKKYDINAPGFTYVGENGTLSLRGREGIFTRPKIKHSSSSSSIQSHIEATLFSHWKSLSALGAAKDLIHNLAEQNWDQVIYNVADPRLAFGVDWTRQNRAWQSLGAGGIITNNMKVDLDALIQDNAYNFNVSGEMDVGKLPYWYQGGAKLKYSVEQVGVGVSVGLDSSGPYGEGHVGVSQRSGHNWLAGQNNINKIKGNVGLFEQEGAHTQIGTLAGTIDNFLSRTKQDQSTTVGAGASVKLSPAGLSGSANVSGAFDQKTTHRSGLSVDEVTPEGGIVKAWLDGAKISGATPEQTTSFNAPKDASVSAGFSIDKDNNLTMNVGVSHGDIRLDLSRQISANNAKDSDEAKKPWTQIGTITVKGVSVPLITSVNKNFFTEFGKDLKTIGNNIIDTVSSLTSKIKEELSFTNIDTNNLIPKVAQIEEESIETLPFEMHGPFLDINAVNNEAPSIAQPREEDIVVASVMPHMLAEIETEGSLIDELANDISLIDLPSLTSPNVPSGNFTELVNKVERVFNGVQPKPMFTVTPPLINPELELLADPFVFEGTTFRYKVKGTNFFLEHPSQLAAIRDFNKVEHLRANNNPYLKRAWEAARHPEMAVFFHNNPELASGAMGEIATSAELKYVDIGQKNLNGDFINVASSAQNQGPKVPEILTHEGAHKAVVEKTGGYFQPGHVAGNEELTAINRIEIIENYAQDLKMLKEQSHNLQLSPQESEALYDFYNRPMEYFEREFRNNLSPETAANKTEMASIIKDAQKGILSGEGPSKRIAQGHSFGTPEIDRALIQGERMIAIELYAFATQGEYKVDGFMKRFAPNTHEWFEADFDDRAFKFRSKPLNQPLVEKTKLVAVEKIPKGSCGDSIDLLTRKVTNANPVINIDAAPPCPAKGTQVAPNKIIGILHHPATKTGMVLIDAVAHIWVASYEYKEDFPRAISEGLINTGNDAVVYGSCIGGIAACAGGPAGICAGALIIAGELAPEIPAELIQHLDKKAKDALYKGNFFESFDCHQKACELRVRNNCKQILMTPRHIAGWTREQFDKAFPELPKDMATVIRDEWQWFSGTDFAVGTKAFFDEYIEYSAKARAQKLILNEML